MTFRFVVPGDPVPWARCKIGRYGQSYTPSKTVDYEALVAWHAKAAMMEVGLQPMNSDARFLVEMTFYLGTDRRIDLDNLQKAILDGLTPRKPRGRERPLGLFWRDDSQVDTIRAQKMRAAAWMRDPCAVVVVVAVGVGP